MIDPGVVRTELDRILESRHFRHSKRAKQFLKFVVEQKIRGKEEQIKERLIGIEVFGRDVDYATGDDSVVRVQAGDVRHRLERYQADADGQQRVSIELPLGGYVPVFHLCDLATNEANLAKTGLEQELSAGSEEEQIEAPAPHALSSIPLDSPIISKPFPQSHVNHVHRILALGVCATLILIAMGIAYGMWRSNSPEAKMRAFWGPALDARKPVLICVGKPIFYQPSTALYKRYEEKHPGGFSTLFERRNHRLPLDSTENILWGDMEAVDNAGPATGGVRAALNISNLFGHYDIPFAVRFGDEATFTELRESPAVIVGALNSRWMMQMSASLHFAIQEVDNRLVIRETGVSGRVWKDQDTQTGWRDFGLITRMLNSSAGQFTIKIEGISDGGTQAGSEVVSNPEDLRNILQDLPSNWNKKNIQMVVATDIIDGKSGPPKVVAFYVW